METNKYNWKYIYNGEDHENPFIITPETEKIVPPTLFKYYSMNDLVIKTFLQGKIYASHPDDFNDIFDCYKNLILWDDEKVVSAFAESVLKEQIKQGVTIIPEIIRDIYREIILKKIGFLSLTPNPDNILMWSHYNKHTGFVVEFDFKNFPFKKYGPFPINYQESIEQISLKEFGMGVCVLYMTNIKSNLWKYEDEWRIIIDSEGIDMVVPEKKHWVFKRLGGRERTFDYSIETIKSISLGYRFFREIGEIKQAQKAWEIEIDLSSDEDANRMILLTFISENDIPVKMCLPGRDFLTIKFLEGTLEKVDELKFIFHYTL
jgi:hypothetical protein